jgi:FdrA protein
MKTLDLIQPNKYQDSVTLMQVAVKLRALEGIDDASLMMGTEPNKEMLRDAGLLTPEGQAAGPNDLIVALRGTESAVEAAAGQLESLLAVEVATGEAGRREVPHTLAAGLAAFPEANLVLISTPGLYAAAEARKALLAGRHVMVFSDNVSLEDERALKALATERGLLLMGPDCGTAIIGGVPLGFANVVRRGVIGVVGASGTGMQEVTSLVDRYGQGISHAIGTGSHDLSERINGAMTLAGLEALLDDPGTSVVVLVSKPPHPVAADRVLALAARAAKPVVVAFLGASRRDTPHMQGANLLPVETLEDAARQAVELAGGTTPLVEDAVTAAQDAARQLRPGQRYVRGLFSGGTFCYEAMLLLQPSVGTVRSNTPLTPDLALPDPHRSEGHVCLDLGSDEFTVGRPHPMIDMTARAERILSEAEDPEVAVLLLDVVLGYGAHPNPAGVLSEAIKEARSRAAAGGRTLPVIAHICGTEGDPQGLEAQRQLLATVAVSTV